MDRSNKKATMAKFSVLKDARPQLTPMDTSFGDHTCRCCK